MSLRSRGGWFGLFRPYYWPRWLRRAALVTLPLALPLWMLLVATVGLLELSRTMGRPIRDFWTAPRRRRSPYYGYLPSSRRRSRRSPPPSGTLADNKFVASAS